MRIINLPNTRLQLTAQLAAKNHVASLASLAMTAQKSRIIQAFLAPSLLGAAEALAVGLLSNTKNFVISQNNVFCRSSDPATPDRKSDTAFRVVII
jgi:hypothetical protein